MVMVDDSECYFYMIMKPASLTPEFTAWRKPCAPTGTLCGGLCFSIYRV